MSLNVFKISGLVILINLYSCGSGVEKKEPGLKLWYKQPAKVWNEALPLGNGRLAAMIEGGTKKEIITLNEETLWSGFPEDNNNPEAKEYLPLVRQAIFNGEYEKADELSLNMQGAKCAPYAPMANLLLNYETGDSVYTYYRDLDIENALSNVRYKTEKGEFTREALISNPDQVMVIKFKSKEPGQLSFSVGLSSLLKHSVKIADNKTIILSGKCPKIANPLRFPDNPIQYDSLTGEGMNFDARLQLLLKDGDLVVQDSILYVRNSSEVELYFSAGTSFNGFDKSPGLNGKDPGLISNSYLNKAIQKGYDNIRKDHISDYSSLYKRMKFDLNTVIPEGVPTDELLGRYNAGDSITHLEELLFQFGRYLFISSSREGGIPIHLQGKWSNLVLPPWNDNYTTNINLQMSYWMGNSTNLSELNEPLFKQIKNMSINGQKTAEINYGCRGWCAHHNSDIWAMTYPAGEFGKFGVQSIKWMNFPLAGAWLCQHLYDHYLFTQDIDFLQKDAYPIMKGATIFLLDYMVMSPDGNLVTCPSTSPENSFYTNDGKVASADMASTIDIAIVRELFNNCIESASLLNIDNNFADSLNAALDLLPEYKIGKYGQLQEWYHDWEEPEVTHRHLSQLYGLHPGSEISPLTTPELAEACEKSLQRRGDEATGWSLAWKINMWARLLDGNKAHVLIKKLLKQIDPSISELGFTGGGTYPNLMGSCPPLILDSNFSYVSGVAEMLLQSQLGEIHLLPALPEAWPSGKVTGLGARGGFIVDIEWDKGELVKFAIQANKSGSYPIRYNNSVKKLEMQAGSLYTFNLSDIK